MNSMHHFSSIVYHVQAWGSSTRTFPRSMPQMDLAVWQATAPLLGGWKLPDEDLILPVAYGRGFFDGESTIENC